MSGFSAVILAEERHPVSDMGAGIHRLKSSTIFHILSSCDLWDPVFVGVTEL